jgi:hypothetical protein
MDDTLPLTSRMILQRWTAVAPEMVATLAASNQLLLALSQANEQLLETLYQLTMVQKMEYNAALEIALNEWRALPSSPPR